MFLSVLIIQVNKLRYRIDNVEITRVIRMIVEYCWFSLHVLLQSYNILAGVTTVICSPHYNVCVRTKVTQASLQLSNGFRAYNINCLYGVRTFNNCVGRLFLFSRGPHIARYGGSGPPTPAARPPHHAGAPTARLRASPMARFW